jgi:hypothetical protein
MELKITRPKNLSSPQVSCSNTLGRLSSFFLLNLKKKIFWVFFEGGGVWGEGGKGRV